MNQRLSLEILKGGENMPECVRCNKCDAVYTDQDCIDLVKKWLAAPGGYAPCPDLSCRGQLELKECSV